MKKYICFMMGPNGSGKGTLARDLAEKYGYYHFNAGNCFRDYAGKYDRQDIWDIINNGEFVSNELFEECMNDKFDEINQNQKIIVDGAPRLFEQVSIIQKLAEHHNYEPLWIIMLNAPLEVLLERVKDRVTAPDGNVYHMTLNPPPKKFKLSELHARPDDRPDVVKKRYESFMTKTLPCLTHPYLMNVKIHSIDSTQSIPNVFANAEQFVDEVETNIGK